MTTTQQLTSIRIEIETTRQAFNEARTSKRRIKLSEDLDWLTGKAAALQHSIDLGL